MEPRPRRQSSCTTASTTLMHEDDEILNSLKLLGLGPASQWATSELRDTARQITQEHHNQGWDLRLLEWMIAQGLEGRSGGAFED